MAPRLSVEEIIRQHPRERLFVAPAEWTARHLELLQCFFGDDVSGRHLVSASKRATLAAATANATAARRAAGVEQAATDAAHVDPRPLAFWAHVAEGLITLETKSAVIRRLLTEQNGPLVFVRPYGFFHYGPDHEFRLHGTTFSRATDAPRSPSRSPKPGPPILAFLQRGLVRVQRQNVYPLPRPRRREHRNNRPVIQVQQLQLKQIEPPDHWRDPYIAAVLIGLAQAQLEALDDESDDGLVGFAQTLFRVCAILVDETNMDYLTIYTSEISFAFLGKFESPGEFQIPQESINAAKMPIKCETISFRPFATLRERLIERIIPQTSL